jgi:predicted dehydrogenase
VIEPLKVGVIGLGFLRPACHARIYAEHLCAELVCACDRDPERTNEATGITGAAGFADYRALLGLPGLHAVSICLPDRLHEEAAIAAAEAGKAILLEKPFAHTASAARRIMEAVKHNRVRLMVGHILRFDPRYVRTFHAAAPERLGEPIHLRAKRNGVRSTARRLGNSSSILFYMGVHDVDACSGSRAPASAGSTRRSARCSAMATRTFSTRSSISRMARSAASTIPGPGRTG